MNPFEPFWVERSIRLLVFWFEDGDDFLKISSFTYMHNEKEVSCSLDIHYELLFFRMSGKILRFF